MRPLISLITSAAFLLHMGLGNCAHHEHAPFAAACAIPAPHGEGSPVHGHSHGHHHSKPDSDAPKHPGGSHDDNHQSHSTFLVTGKTTVDPDTQVAALPAVALDAVIAQTASSSTNWIRDTGDHLHLPVRLHLFNQVLLI